MRQRIALLLPFALLALVATPAAAESDLGLKLFGGAVWATPIDDSRARLGGEVRSVELEDDLGWEAGLEWRITPLLGLEASMARTTHDVEFGGARLGSVDLEPIYVSLNFHIVDRGRSDWWIAPTIALFEWRDAGFSRGVEIDEDRDEAFGGTFGVDYRFDDRWSLTAAVRYVDMQLRFGGGGEVAVDPLSVRAGVGFAF
jgi:opacity protein-like surface antigen